MARVDRSADQLDEERPRDDAVDRDVDGAGPHAEREDPDPEDEDAGRDDVEPGLDHRPEPDAAVLRRRADPRGDAGDHTRRDDQHDGDADPTREPPRARHRPDDEVLEAPVRLLLTRAVRLAGGEQRDDDGDDHEGEPEVGLRARAVPAEPFEDLLDRLRARQRLPRGLRDEPHDQRERGDGREPTERHRADEPHREPGRAAQQTGPRDRGVVVSQRAAPDVACRGEPHGRDDEDRDHRAEREQRERMR